MDTIRRAPAGARLPLVVASLALFSFQAWAQDAQVIENPPLLNAISAAAETKQLLQAPAAKPNLVALQRQNEVVPGVASEVYFDLNIEYHNGWIRNPGAEDAKDGKDKFDKVQLRSYVQGDGKPAHSVEPSKDWGAQQPTAYVAPEIEAYPGQTVRISLNNNLPQDQTCVAQGGSANTPHCFNGTNLHSHGLWISPSGNSDNVLTSVSPGVGFQYEYNIPPTHPAGTFWYHPHQHGSTALQVSSGMAGALVIRGTRKPTEQENGDVDTLLKNGEQAFPERVMVFQQIQYACRFPNDYPVSALRGKVKTYANDPVNPIPGDNRYKCDAGDLGKIDGYDLFGSSGWANSGRYTSINGVVLGKLTHARGGVIERWRMIHAGVRDTINLKIRMRKNDAPSAAGLSAAATEQYVKDNCTGPDLPLSLIAADGLTMDKIQVKKNVVFQPGYRWDALTVFPKRGQYCIINELKTTSTVDGVLATRLMGIVDVESDADTRLDLTSVQGVTDYLKEKLEQAARKNLPLVPQVASDIKSKLSLAKFVPHRTIEDGDVKGYQTLVFNIETSLPGATLFEVDGHPYDGNRIDRVLPLGSTEEWTLTSKLASHPFHIHVNPFQIVKVIAPDGTDVSLPDAKDGDDNQYAGLKGLWKDTIWVKNQSGIYTVVVRTRYERYIGDFVLHCHILDHEDQGMMQNVRIAVPDGHGGTAAAHH